MDNDWFVAGIILVFCLLLLRKTKRGEQWKSRTDDPAAIPIAVRTTDYGYELVSIGQHSASAASVVTGERK